MENYKCFLKDYRCDCQRFSAGGAPGAKPGLHGTKLVSCTVGRTGRSPTEPVGAESPIESGGVMEVFEIVVALLLGGAALAALARRFGAPYPALVALAGATLALI